MSMNNLEAKLSGLETTSLNMDISGYPVFIIKNKSCTAKVALHGAHLFDWTPMGHEPVIYNSPEAIYREGKAIRGGIPICWPWFNAHPTDSSLPSHGIARNRFWEFLAAEETGEETTLTFRLTSSKETKIIWPYDFQVTAKITLGTEATISLTTENTGSQKFTVGGALHTYLHVNNINDTTITNLDGKAYLDTVGENTERIQSGDITFTGEVDRIYQNTSEIIRVVDKKRTISVDRIGSNTAVIWNPWIEKAAGLGDLPNEAYTDFVCVEAANAHSDVHVLLPSKRHLLSTTIKVV